MCHGNHTKDDGQLGRLGHGLPVVANKKQSGQTDEERGYRHQRERGNRVLAQHGVLRCFVERENADRLLLGEYSFRLPRLHFRSEPLAIPLGEFAFCHEPPFLRKLLPRTKPRPLATEGASKMARYHSVFSNLPCSPEVRSADRRIVMNSTVETTSSATNETTRDRTVAATAAGAPMPG